MDIIIQELMLTIYFIIAFAILFVLDRKYSNDTQYEDILRKSQFDSFLILCSILWLPFLIVIVFCVLIQKIFERDDKNERSSL